VSLYIARVLLIFQREVSKREVQSNLFKYSQTMVDEASKDVEHILLQVSSRVERLEA